MGTSETTPAEREGEIRKQHVYFAGGKNSPGVGFDDYHEAAHFIRCNSWLVEPYIEMLPALRPAAAAPEGELSGNAGELPEYKLPESHDDDPEWDGEWYDTLINQVEQTSYTLGLTAANTDEWPTSIEKKVELYREQLRAYGRKCIAARTAPSPEQPEQPEQPDAERKAPKRLEKPDSLGWALIGREETYHAFENNPTNENEAAYDAACVALEKELERLIKQPDAEPPRDNHGYPIGTTLTDLLYAAEERAAEGQRFDYSPEDFAHLPELFAVEFPDAWQPDAEPVGYALCDPEGYMTEYTVYPTREAAEEQSWSADLVTPLYRHPAPASGKLAAGIDADRVIECAEGMSAFAHGSDGFDAYRRKLCRLLGKPEDHISSHRLVIGFPVAVAGQGVVERLKMKAAEYAAAKVHCYRLRCNMYPRSFCSTKIAEDELDAALAGITVLPEPSEWAKERVVFNNPNIGGRGWSPEQRLDLAAALVAASLRATAKEGK